MNIDNEIKELEKQIASLKKKKEQDKVEKERRISLQKLNYGQLYIKDNCLTYIALVVSYDIDRADKWGYVFDDGSGESFDSKEQLAEYFLKNNFTYYGKMEYFGHKK